MNVSHVHCECCRRITRRDYIATAAAAPAVTLLPDLPAADPAAAKPAFIDIHFLHNS
jgi:hypothetical protein